MKMLYFLLLLLIGSFDATSASCDCPSSEHTDLKQLRNFGTSNKLISDKLGDSSKQICVSYTMAYLSLFSQSFSYPSFSTQAIQNAEVKDSCGPKNSDGSIDCQIDSTSFSLGQCYPEKQFCIHQVVCPSNHKASFQCSSLDLPKTANGKCLDSLFIASNRLDEKQYCGTTADCFSGFNEIGASRIRIIFTGGKCCQRCGYRIWVKCIPQPSNTGQKGSSGPTKRDIEEHEIEERGARGPPGPVGPPGPPRPRPPTKVVVPAGAVLTYKNRKLTVKQGTKTLQTRWTSKLQVRDDIAYGSGVLFEAKRTANRSFVGYGIMTIYSNRIYYHQQGVPPNEKPTTAEQRFIDNVVKYLKIDDQSSGGNKGLAGTVAGSCQCSGHPGPTGSPPTGQKGERGPAGPTGPQGPPSGFDALAKYYAKNGRIDIVRSWAKKYLKHNVKPTSPPIGPQGPQGPSGPQ
ncbi:PREDICTED: uncharacterized protein LOC109587410 [Amphimedon queenslandica]|uniref:CUB domain-containing protein n=1 Tax=Amphimedon queenslandica TaxID=400682 RepID=A0A1X7TJK9_AMPQE|nr:PREDICTED: uncharacterized protein LOC109587410 [Amphimedon queenslandica]|eukprot:XP_019859209.1 PREDICTED: uncharacterized protein LOC109587410 [Amphimedon queenslandica]